MIKAGQIYRTKFLKYIKAVTYIEPWIEGQENAVDGICLISPSGEHDVLDRSVMEEAELIAEYPTWQEAVNSKEFMDD